MHERRPAILILLACLALAAHAQQQTAGTFLLHKFSQAIGKETYSIQTTAGAYTLNSHFLFTDRNTPVPLETSFTASTKGMVPISFVAQGKSARDASMDDHLHVQNGRLAIQSNGRSSEAVPAGPWFITDGYAPVAMQEQMMRWWLSHGRPAAFTVYPAAVPVHIEPARDLTALGRTVHGYTIAGLIWGQESLWLDDAGNLAALVSTDAEFDHFEAAREDYEAALPLFITAAVESNLAALEKLSAAARVQPARILAITGATLEDSTGAPPVPDAVIVIQDGVITAAGSRATTRIPRGAQRLDAAGKYAVPGLWDMHAHYEQVEWGPIYLAAGITTARDCGNEFDYIVTLHNALNRKTRVPPSSRTRDALPASICTVSRAADPHA